MAAWTAETCRHALIKAVVTHYCGIFLCIDVNKYLYILLLCHTTGWSTLSTFYAEFMYVYRIFLSGRVSKIQKNLNVQNSALRVNETGRNFPLKCRGLWFSPVFGFRYINLQCPAIVCQKNFRSTCLGTAFP